MKVEDCPPTLSGYETMLKLLKGKETHSEEDLEVIIKLEKYIKDQEKSPKK